MFSTSLYLLLNAKKNYYASNWIANMWFLLVFTYLFVAPHVLGGDLKSRMLSGQMADIAEFPFFAALKDCGATIISESWLVTAAHCVALDDHKFGPVWVGGNDTKTSQQLKYDTVVIHPEFKISEQFLPNNIALLRLAEPLTITDTIRPVALPTDNDKDIYQHDSYGGNVYTIVGKGMRKGNLMKIEVTSLSLEDCLAHFSLAERMVMYHYRHTLYDYLCTQRDINMYDMLSLSRGASGSPLVRHNVLEGIAVAFGDPLQSTVSMFIKITKHTEWIRFITGIKSGFDRIDSPYPRM